MFYKQGDSDTAGKVVSIDNKDVFYINVGKLRNNFADSDQIISTTHNNVIQKAKSADVIFNSGQFLSVDYLPTALERSQDQIESLNIILKL